MQVVAFRIQDFRSIADTAWCKLSPDRITVLVGQNESGKSSVLEALATTLGDRSISDDDVRMGTGSPTVFLKMRIEQNEVSSLLPAAEREQIEAIQNYLTTKDRVLEIAFRWRLVSSDGSPSNWQRTVSTDDPLFWNELATIEYDEEEDEKEITPGNPIPVPTPRTIGEISPNDFANAIVQAGPVMALFSHESGLLPNQVDIATDGPTPRLIGEGALAAENFLRIAEIDLSDLVKNKLRGRENILGRANARLTEDFALFWTQTIGRKGYLSIECTIGHYDGESPDKAGKPYLAFWISDGKTKLFPKQRSQGVRWFVSFYLQLRASEKKGRPIFFLLDEPGANLHSRAQKDVLKLVNELNETIAIMYSTHSPDLIEYGKLYRILAVQRDGDEQDNPSKIIDAHSLASASRDTLSPILNAMGADLSAQQVIKKRNNVILEELSAFYYLTAFLSLHGVTQEVNFIAATGVNNVEQLAYMFLGWGLHFIVAVDDDQSGRKVYNALKREMFGDNEGDAQKKLVKLKECPGIEDIFSNRDFARHVLGTNEDIGVPPSEFVKTTKQAKAVLAYQFKLAVEQGTLNLSNFDDTTQKRTLEVLRQVTSRLDPTHQKTEVS